MTDLVTEPRTSSASTLIPLLYTARGLRGFGDGFAIIILPAYMTALGYDAVAVGLVATASLLGTALLTLIIFHVDLNIYSFVGLMMLIGIVKKNAIMQIDFALQAERTEGKSPAEAIYEGCLIRFRPIMMTTMAAMLGAIPISIGYGAGGESRRPLGLAVVGGLLFSQLITLYLTPVVYTYMAGVLDWWRHRHAIPQLEAPQGALGD